MEKLLDGVGLISDLKKLNNGELDGLCREIREEIISSVAANGGHPASALGAVEAITALCKVYDFPKDKLIFDVGHQAYAYKILSGRREAFRSMRRENGISGFPCVDEGEYDAFTSGHAGTSISAGLGYCFARDLNGEDYNVVCFVGDASFFNGENLEAVFSCNKKPSNFLVVYNDNGMGISLGENGAGSSLEEAKVLDKAVEALGFSYFGAVDGHDISALCGVLGEIKKSGKPAFLHIKTVKGKGYDLAEQNAEYYHGVGGGFSVKENSFADCVSSLMCSLCEKDKKITAVCAGMKFGTGLSDFAEKYPQRFYDAGICEESAVSFAAGAALAGLKPVVFIYSTFLQRSFDQIITDVCLQKLPVVFMIDRAGFVGSDGRTHQGVFDLGYLRQIPGMTVFAPKDCDELEICLKKALDSGKPSAVRYPAGTVGSFGKICEINDDSPWETLKEGKRASILAVGPRALSVALEATEKFGDGVRVINARRVTPLDQKTLDEIACGLIITVEENSLACGFGESVLGYYAGKGVCVKVKNYGVKNEFVFHAEVASQLEKNDVSAKKISQFLKDNLI